MRQYLKKHIEFIVLAVALLFAMLFQYIRISNIDIAFLYETSIANYMVYVVVILLIPVVVLFFVFAPLLLVFEIGRTIYLPQPINIKVTKVIYNSKLKINTIIKKPRLYTVLRC